MIDTKSCVQGRKHTLLHYLTELVDRKFPKLAEFINDLKHVEEGSKGISSFDLSWYSTN